MFSKYIGRILRSLPLFIASLTMVGCSDDIGMKPDYTRSGEEVEIKVAVTLPRMDVQTRADLDESSLNQVNSLWIRTYSADTGKATSDWIEVTDPLPTTDTEVARPVTFKTQSGRTFIVGVANVENNGVTRTNRTPTPLRELLAEANTWQEFLDIAAVTPSSYQNVRAPQPPLTMAGCFSDLIVGTEPANIADWQTKNFQSYFIPAQSGTVDLTTQGAIHMRRVVSHVNFNFIPVDDLTLTVNSYQVMNAPRYSWVYERPSLNGMMTNYGDLAASEEEVTTFFADVPQYNSQFVTENQDGSSSFDFWQGENKHTGTAVSYGDRGKISVAGHFTSLMGDEWSPNNEASYVLVNCTVEYKDPLHVNGTGEITPGGEEVYRTGEVTYLIHLGAVGGVLSDFNCYRNANYTYNVTVRGINDIRLDAYATDETFHNEEGMVVDITQATVDIDAHYAAFNIELTEAELRANNFGFLIIAYEDGNQYTITEKNTRGGNQGSIIYDDNGNVIPEKYYNWIELRPTTGESVLAEYRPRFGGNADGATFLLSSLTNGWISMGENERSSSGWYTVFVNEYTYEPMFTGNNSYANEEWNGTGDPDWMGYVNQNPRRFYIRVQQKESPDGNSIYARSKYGVSQQSMMTFYSDQTFAPASGNIPAGTAIGVERENETLGMNLVENYTYGSSLNNGRYNVASYINDRTSNGSITSANVNNRPAWDGYINYDKPLEVGAVTGLRAQGGPELPARTIALGNAAKIPGLVISSVGDAYSFTDPQPNNNYRVEAITACMSRNRDNNGNGRIDPDELRWFVPAIDQYLQLMMGSSAMTDPLMEYQTIAGLPYVNSTNASSANTFQNTAGYIKNDYYSRYMFVASNSNESGSNVLWGMEGTSLSTYSNLQGWTGRKSRPWQVRCIRNLGADLTTITADNKVSQIYVHDATSRSFRIPYINSAAIRVNAYGANGTGASQMPIHTINSLYNRLYYGFEYASTDLTVPSGSRTTAGLVTYINTNPCSDQGTGFRVPNQEELSLLCDAGILQNSAATDLWVSCTMNYFQYNNGNGNSGTNNKYFLGSLKANGTQADATNLSSAGNGLRIRCVRDINN